MNLRAFVTRRPRLAKLALKIWEWSDWSLPTEPDFRAFGWLNLRPGCFLDVGAHVGESARSFRLYDKTTPIVSIEPNPESFRRLSRLERKLPGFETRLAFASDHEHTVVLQVPVVGGVAFPSLGGDDRERILERLALRWNTERSRVTFTTETIRALPLDNYGLELAVLKIDVEGHEREVLRGLRRTIERDLPLILLEIEMEDIGAIIDDLQPFGYHCMIYLPATKRFRPFGPSEPHVTQNAWFVPQRDLDQFPMEAS